MTTPSFSEQLKADESDYRLMAMSSKSEGARAVWLDRARRVGRASELARLWEVWEAADDGSGDLDQLQEAESALLAFAAEESR